MNSPRNYRKLNSNGKRSWTQKNYFQIQDRKSQLENRNKKIDTIPKTPESVRVCDHCTLNFIFHCKLYNDLIKEISILEIISERNKLFRKFDYCGKLLFLFNNTDPYICRLNAVFVFEPWNISLVAICYDYISHTTLRSGNTGIKLLLMYLYAWKKAAIFSRKFKLPLSLPFLASKTGSVAVPAQYNLLGVFELASWESGIFEKFRFPHSGAEQQKIRPSLH